MIPLEMELSIGETKAGFHKTALPGSIQLPPWCSCQLRVSVMPTPPFPSTHPQKKAEAAFLDFRV